MTKELSACEPNMPDMPQILIFMYHVPKSGKRFLLTYEPSTTIFVVRVNYSA